MRKIVEDVEMPAPTGVTPGDPPPEQPPLNPDEEEHEAGPEEQAFYDQFTLKAIEFIHGPKSSRAVMKHLNQKDLSVPEAVGRTTAFIAGQILNSAKSAKQDVFPDAVLEASQEIVEELLEVGARSKIFPIEWPEGEAELSQEQSDLAAQSASLASHYFGSEFVKTPEGKNAQPEAEKAYLSGIAREADAGTLDPDFAAAQGVAPPTTVRGGVKRALIRQVE